MNDLDINRAIHRVIVAAEQAIEETEGAVMLVECALKPDHILKGRLLDMQEAMQLIESGELQKLKEAFTGDKET